MINDFMIINLHHFFVRDKVLRIFVSLPMPSPWIGITVTRILSTLMLFWFPFVLLFSSRVTVAGVTVSMTTFLFSVYVTVTWITIPVPMFFLWLSRLCPVGWFWWSIFRVAVGVCFIVFVLLGFFPPHRWLGSKHIIKYITETFKSLHILQKL
jgi:hypothetical protein